MYTLYNKLFVMDKAMPFRNWTDANLSLRWNALAYPLTYKIFCTNDGGGLGLMIKIKPIDKG